MFHKGHGGWKQGYCLLFVVRKPSSAVARARHQESKFYSHVWNILIKSISRYTMELSVSSNQSLEIKIAVILLFILLSKLDLLLNLGLKMFAWGRNLNIVSKKAQYLKFSFSYELAVCVRWFVSLLSIKGFRR